jgi:Amt family ammonium transporter
VGIHGAGGILGALATGVFASTLINPAGADGLILGNPSLLLAQAVAVGATVAYSFVMSLVLLKAVDLALGLRVHEEQEEMGLDLSQHSEAAYGF